MVLGALKTLQRVAKGIIVRERRDREAASR
jgi:hypothetical protein